MITPRKKTFPDIFILLPLLALGIDLSTPFLISNKILPAEVRWLSHVMVALMILLTIIQVFSAKHIPHSLWVILAVSIVWSYVAVGHGQGIPSTLWGVWLLFQFPLVCLFACLQPNPPKQLPANIQKYALILLGVEVMVQLFQYASGEQPGDDLAGLFGNNGTGIALIFALMVNCLFLGYWIVTRRWGGFVASLGLGLLSCALGEVKLFPYVITAAGLMAIVTYAIKFRSLGRAFITLTLIVVALFGFVSIYNSIVPSADDVPFQAYLEDPSRLYDYLNFSKSSYSSDGARYSDFGRMYALEVGWKSIKRDPVTLLFGYGIGARSESRTWGTTGVALTSGAFGWSVGTSLLILMQETGVVGLIMFGGLIVWIIFSLVHAIRAIPTSPANGIRYALVFVSLLWPIMLWYSNVWAMRVPMVIYWYLLGYVLAESRTLEAHAPERTLELSVQGA